MITYAVNTAIPGEPAISCNADGRFSRNLRGIGALTYSAWPPLSTLGGSVGLSPTSGIVSGTTGPTPQSPTLFTITAVDSATGYAGYFEFYASVSSSE